MPDMNSDPDLKIYESDLLGRAVKTVGRNAESVDEARIFLDMLGLHRDEVRFPSWTVGERGTRRAPSTGPAAPLPSSGYGSGSV